MSYQDFVARKLSTVPPTGITGRVDLAGSLFPHQAALTQWALKRGRAAIFADTGLGKMRMELAWADAVQKYTNQPVMIHTPLAVAAQIAREAALVGIVAKVCREQSDLVQGINITNYDRLHKFDTSIFGAVVLDESGCIKHSDTRTFKTLTEAYRDTPFKLPASATPAPNDWTELGTHAEFLGICTKQEMLAEFFTHDGGDTSVWRLKGHARDIFWRWVSSWGAMIRRPSDLGFDDGAYNLPALHVHEHQVSYEMPLNGMLFATDAQSLSERREARRASMADRVAECVSLILGDLQSNERAREESVSSGVLPSQQAQVQEENAGSAGCLQRDSTREVCRERGVQREDQAASEGVSREEAQNTSEVDLRAHSGSVRRADDCAEPRLRDLRPLGEVTQSIPDDRSLSHQRQGAGNIVRGVQSRTGEVQGQPGVSSEGNRVSQQQWVVWCELNSEQDALEAAFGPLAFSIRGADSSEEKESRLERWLAGERPIILSKPAILGWGINMQNAARMAFVGVTDSYEAYYQAVRRCWRFGQTRDVHVHVFASKAEGAVVANLTRKERDAGKMAESLSAETRNAVMAEVTGLKRETNDYNAGKTVSVPAFLRSAA